MSSLSVGWRKMFYAAGMLFAFPVAMAADNPEAADSSRPSEQLEEITVTATRREESMAHVPISISALSHAELTDSGVKNISDLAAETPGLQFSTPVAPSTITTVNIRGINTNNGPSTVGIYLDDTPLQTRLSPLGNVGGPLPLVNDLNRVEVERGPQGTLFGAGSEGGTIRFITNGPSLHDFGGAASGEFSVTKGGQPSYEYGVALGGPIKEDDLGFRISAWSRRDGGYIDLVNPLPGPSANNAVVQSDINRNYEQAFRAAVGAKIGEIRITPAIYYQSVTRDDSGKFYPAYSDTAEEQYNDASFYPEHSVDHWWLPTLKVEAPLPFADLTFTSSYLHRDVTVTNDFVDCFVCFGGSGYGSPLGGDVPTSPLDAAPTTTGQRNEAYTEELRLASNDPGAYVTWVGGLFFDSRTQQDYQNTTQISTNSSGAPVFLVNQHYKDTQVAVFGQADVHLTKKWTATAGVRVAHDRIDFNASQSGAAPGSSPTQIAAPPSGARGSATPTTPRVALSYQVNPDNLFYVSATKGYRVGGGNAPLPVGCTGAGYQEAYGPDWVWSYEIGSKNKLFNERIEIDSSVYHMTWSKIQVLVNASPCDISFVANAGNASSNGFDLGMRALLTDRLRLDLKASYTNAYYTDSVFFSGDVATVRDGEKIGFLPQVVAPWNIVVAGEYRFPLADSTAIRLRIEDRYNSHNPGPFQNGDPNGVYYVPLLRADPATNLVNARASYSIGGLDASLFATNVFNSQPLIGSLSFTPISSADRLAYSTFRPRTIGIALNYAF